MSFSPGCAQSDAYWEEVQRANVSTTNEKPALGCVLQVAVANFMQLTPRSGNTFSISAFEVTTTPSYLSNGTRNLQRTVVYPVFDFPGVVEFLVDDEGSIEGFGMRSVWGAGPLAEQPAGKSVRERAEVWFDRLD